jgi:glycosyltransferase involved in cell wall biosynthesis
MKNQAQQIIASRDPAETTPSPRLLIVVNDAEFFLSHRAVLARAATARGWQVHVAYADGGRGRLTDTPDWTAHRVPMSRSGLSPVGNLRSLFALALLCRRLRPDLVHAVALKGVVLGGLAARVAGVEARLLAIAGLGQVITATQGRGARLGHVSQRLLPWIAGRRGRVIVQNENDLAWVRGTGIPESRITLIPGSGVDLNAFPYRPEPDGPLLAILPARMIWKKGVGEFVAAARLLKERGTPLRMALVGAPDPGNPSSVPEQTLRQWDREGIVEWMGLRSDMPAVIGSSHIVALPSFYGEGVPKVLLEAAAIGRPVVTTDTPGCRHAVQDGENGILVPPEDAEALASALEELVKDPAVRRRYGEAGRARAERLFDVSGVVTQHLDLYQSLLEERRAGAK